VNDQISAQTRPWQGPPVPVADSATAARRNGAGSGANFGGVWGWCLGRDVGRHATSGPRSPLATHREGERKRGSLEKRSLTRDRGFESFSLQRRVRQPSVPQRRNRLGVSFVLSQLAAGARVLMLSHGVARLYADRFLIGGATAAGLVAFAIIFGAAPSLTSPSPDPR